MREIRFRAFDPDAKQMIYFDNMKASKDQYIASHLCVLLANKHIKGKDLLQQYTGLKDKNGVEIYEGDVLRIYPTNQHVAVEWCEKTHAWGLGEEFLYELNHARDIVIGNIFENPELLESEK